MTPQRKEPERPAPPAPPAPRKPDQSPSPSPPTPEASRTPASGRSYFQRPGPRRPEGGLTFSPLAWLKLLFFLHAGDTEIGGFGLSAAPAVAPGPARRVPGGDADAPRSQAEDPSGGLLDIEDFITVRQRVTMASVAFEDDAVADYFDTMADRGLHPAQCGRIWVHTHPGQSAQPSGTDEETFSRVFGGCDWSVMFILGRTQQTYARLSFPATRTSPGAALLLPVRVDWARWPHLAADPAADLPAVMRGWVDEYLANIHPDLPVLEPVSGPRPQGRGDRPQCVLEYFDQFAQDWDLAQEEMARMEAQAEAALDAGQEVRA